MAPDPSPSSPAPADDPSASLEEIRERYRIHDRSGSGVDSASDVPVLLAAIEAALAYHQPITRRQGWNLTCSYDSHAWPCPEVVAITAELAGHSTATPPSR